MRELQLGCITLHVIIAELKSICFLCKLFKPYYSHYFKSLFSVLLPFTDILGGQCTWAFKLPEDQMIFIRNWKRTFNVCACTCVLDPCWLIKFNAVTNLMEEHSFLDTATGSFWNFKKKKHWTSERQSKFVISNILKHSKWKLKVKSAHYT